MPRYRYQQQQGFTLLELLVGLSVAGILLVCVSHSWNDLLPRYQVRTATMTLHSLIRQARAGAVSYTHLTLPTILLV